MNMFIKIIRLLKGKVNGCDLPEVPRMKGTVSGNLMLSE